MTADFDKAMAAARLTTDRTHAPSELELATFGGPAPVSPIQPAVGGAEALQKLFDEVGRILPILVRAEDCGLWPELSAGTGVATTNGLVSALGKARAALASTSPAQTGDVETLRQGNWHHPDGGRIIGWLVTPEEVERIGADAFVLPREVAECVERLTTRQTGGVDQAWVDEAETLTREFEEAVIDFERFGGKLVQARVKHARESLRTHLSTALGAKGKS